MPDCAGHFDCGGPDSKSIPCSQVCNRTWACRLHLFGMKYACGLRSAVTPIIITCALMAASFVPGHRSGHRWGVTLFDRM